MPTKAQRTKKRINLFYEQEKNYKNDIKDKTKSDQINDKYLL